MKLKKIITPVQCPKRIQTVRLAEMTRTIALASTAALALWIVATFGLISYEALATGVACGGSGPDLDRPLPVHPDLQSFSSGCLLHLLKPFHANPS